MNNIERFAVITDIDWYTRSVETAEALPGMTIRHFELGQRAAALAWLQARG